MTFSLADARLLVVRSLGLVRRGLDVKSVQYLMGHASAGVTLDVYSHVNYTDVKEKMLDLAS